MRRTRPNQTLSYSIQDYLKCIYDLTQGGGEASTNAIVARLQLSPASVTSMLQKLAATAPPLVSYKKHRGATLTRPGRRAALHVIRHHRLLETWLAQTLGYAWDEVHGEARDAGARDVRGLGGTISARAGKSCTRSPWRTHSVSGPSHAARRECLLSELTEGQDAIVRRVQADDTAALKHFKSLGLLIGSRIKTKAVSRYDHVVTLQIRGRRQAVTIGPAVTNRVYVEVIRRPRPKASGNPG